MNLKRRITYFMCFILLFCIIGCSCSKKGEKTVDSSKEVLGTEVSSEASGTEVSSEALEGEVSPWKLLSESTVNTEVNYAGFLNESTGVTVGYAGAISYTSDGGKTWSQSSNKSACRFGLDYYDESFIVSSGNSGVNLVSTDKGKSWSNLAEFPLKSGEAYNKFLSVLDTKNIYIGSQKALAFSNDGGLSWNELALPENCTRIEGMFFLTPEIGYLVNSDGTLYKTNDSCKSWTTQTIDLAGEKIGHANVPSVAMSFQDENHGMLIISTKSIKVICLKTEDGGSTWESVVMPKVSCFNPYLSRDGKYLTLSSSSKKICLYQLEDE